MDNFRNQQIQPVPPGKKIFLVGALTLLGLLVYLMTRHIGALPPSAAVPQSIAENAAAGYARVPVGFRVGGRIAQMFYAEHASVKKGDVLASLDKAPFEQALAAAQAQLQLAQADYNNSLRIPTSNFNAIEAARANVETAQHVYDEARSELEKRRSIMVTGQLDNVFSDDVQNERDAELALQRARRELAQQEDAAGNAGSREAYRAALQAAIANVTIAENNLADAELTAPAAGTVISRESEPGAIVPANTSVYVLSVRAAADAH